MMGQSHKREKGDIPKVWIWGNGCEYFIKDASKAPKLPLQNCFPWLFGGDTRDCIKKLSDLVRDRDYL